MAVLEKIRVKFGLAISIIIALALLSFIIDPSTLETALHSMSSKYDVGRIDGKSISYTDFQEEVDKYTAINELVTGSSVQNEESQKQIRDAAWQGLLDKFMFIKNAKEAGINVGEEEMVSLTTGDNVSPILVQSGLFADENGNFSPDMLVNLVKQIDADETGQLRTYWNYLQNTIYTQQFYAKYGSLFTQGELTNALELENLMALNNTTADFEYVTVPYPFQRDTTIEVTGKEITDFYKSHKNFFKQEANREIEYVVFEVVPSASDIEAANESVASVYEEFGTTDNMKAFLLKNSDRSLSSYWYKNGELSTVSSALNDEIFEQGKDVTSIVKDGNVFYAARVMESAMIPDSVYVKHILLQGTNAQSLADSLVNVLGKGENFANLVAEFSADQNSSDGGVLGNIGWMTQTYTIPGFEPTLTAQTNKPFVLKTQYGTHVVVVSEKTAPIAKKQIAILEKEALASKETFNNFYAQANNFATIAGGTYEGYQKALDTTKVYSHPMTITEATSNYGSIDQAKEVTRWAFEAKAGKASNIITVNNNYFFVVALKAIHKEGYANVNDVARAITETLYTQKLQDKVVAETAEKIKGLTTIEAIAEALGTEVETKSGSLASASLDPALIGAVQATEVGAVSGAVKGNLGAYVLKVGNKQVESFYTEEDAKNYGLQKAQYTSQQVVPVMMENGEVKDNREHFF